MSRHLVAFAILSAVAAAPVSAAVTLDYSLYTLGSYTEQGGSRIGGGVAVAGNAQINSAAIGADLTGARDNSAVVAVGGNIAYDNSALAHGNVVYGGSNGSGQYTQAMTPGGSFAQGTSLDFTDINRALIGLSAGYGATAATGSFSVLYGAGTLTGGSTAGTDIFSLSTADLGSVYALRLVGTAGSKAIINISGANFGSYFSFDRGNYAVSDVVFNFVDAQAVSLGGVNLAASVLAPLANVTQQGGAIAGSIVAGNYTSGGAMIGGKGQFEYVPGDVTGPIPEPATWAMMIAGFGLVGATMRRQRIAAA